MAIYTLTMQDAVGDLSKLLYDPHSNTLKHEDGTPVDMLYKPTPQWSDAIIFSPNEPVAKSNAPTRLKIQMGLKCNYSCSYCLQSSEIPDASVSSLTDTEAFLANMDSWLHSKPSRVEFWGGEPFVYWAHLKRLVPALRERLPDAHFLIITNGSLLNDEKIEFIDKYDISVGISHDAMGQHLRGPDPLQEPNALESIKKLVARRPGRVSANAVLTAGNFDMDAITAWLRNKIDQNLHVSFEGVVHSHDSEMKGEVAASWSPENYAALQFSVIKAMVQQTYAGTASTAGQRGLQWIETLKTHRPSSAVGMKCGMERPDQLAVDLKGNVTTCQNVGAAGKHGIGHVSDLKGVKLTSSFHWSKRDTCGSCPVLQLCQGACMYTDGDDFVNTCENEFHFSSAIMAGALYWITGKMLVRVDGDIRRPKKRKVIPIALA